MIGPNYDNMNVGELREFMFDELVSKGMSRVEANATVNDIQKLDEIYTGDQILQVYYSKLQEQEKPKLTLPETNTSNSKFIDGESELEQTVVHTSIPKKRYKDEDYIRALGISQEDFIESDRIMYAIRDIEGAETLSDLVVEFAKTPSLVPEDERAVGIMRGHLQETRKKRYLIEQNKGMGQGVFEHYKMELIQHGLTELKAAQEKVDDEIMSRYLKTPEGVVSALKGFVDYTFRME